MHAHCHQHVVCVCEIWHLFVWSSVPHLMASMKQQRATHACISLLLLCRCLFALIICHFQLFRCILFLQFLFQFRVRDVNSSDEEQMRDVCIECVLHLTSINHNVFYILFTVIVFHNKLNAFVNVWLQTHCLLPLKLYLYRRECFNFFGATKTSPLLFRKLSHRPA